MKLSDYNLEKKHILILLFNIAVIVFFGLKFMFPFNYEFLIYIGVIIFFFGLLLYAHSKVGFSYMLLWLLSLWSFFHMAGWGLEYNWVIWYKQILLPISETYSVLKYDQVIHAFWFFTATILAYEIIKKKLKNPKIWFWLWLILVMAWCGFGASNEVIEFIVDQSLPESGVGGYINTSVDLVSNLVWATTAVFFLKLSWRDSIWN